MLARVRLEPIQEHRLLARDQASVAKLGAHPVELAQHNLDASFALLFGLAMATSGERGQRVLALFEDLNEVIMRLVNLLMAFAPYGVFCLIAKVFAEQGFAAIEPLVRYFFTVLGVLALHALFTYPLLLLLLAGLSPFLFFLKMRGPMALAFSTASSGAAAKSSTRGQRSTNARQYGVTAATVVCCSMTSLSQTW